MPRSGIAAAADVNDPVVRDLCVCGGVCVCRFSLSCQVLVESFTLLLSDIRSCKKVVQYLKVVFLTRKWVWVCFCVMHFSFAPF